MTELSHTVTACVKNFDHANDYSAVETAIHDKLATIPEVVKLDHAVAKLNSANIAQCTQVSLKHQHCFT